ncbi:MAG: SprT family zinc-dependent metalloprotease [Lachnospiraceae bacterium]|nr:SprT family zinc-dependent metalloprotease [Lachnospiraceae bacterium]
MINEPNQTDRIIIEEFTIFIERKPIKNMYLRILPEDGSIHISAPLDMPEETILSFARDRLSWIRNKKKKLADTSLRQKASARRYLTGETHYLWGKPLYLDVITTNVRPGVELYQNIIQLYVHPENTPEQRKKLLQEWYRQQLKDMIPQIFAHWEPIMGVHAREVHIKTMKTRWGTCNTTDKRIWLNLYLSQKPLKCVEYVIVHELCHLIVPNHSKRFYYYMDLFMPDWKERKNILNQSP